MREEDQALQARLQALETEMARINVMKASELIDWFVKDRIALIGPRVAVLRDITPSNTQSGIILPDTATKKKRCTGTIVILGIDVVSREDPNDDTELMRGVVAVGDRVSFTQYGEIVHQQQFSNGKEVIVDVLNVHDVYFLWRNEDIDASDPYQQLRELERQ